MRLGAQGRFQLVDDNLIFSESLSKFVRCYEYIAQLVDLGDPSLEAFASFARLLRKRLKGIGAEQVDLGDLKLSHYRVKAGERLDGVAVQGESPGLYGITDNGLREARDREKKYLTELIERLNAAFGKDVSDTDQVMLALQVSETLRSDPVVMAQIHNNDLEQALKADLPIRAVEAIVGAMSSHNSMATRLLSDEPSREFFITVLYELLKRDVGAQLLGAARQ